MYFRHVVGTLFTDLLASGARDQIQEMDLIWPVCRHATRRGNMRAHTRGLGRSSSPQQPSLGVAWAKFSFLTSSSSPSILLLLRLYIVGTHFKIQYGRLYHGSWACSCLQLGLDGDLLSRGNKQLGHLGAGE